MYLVGEQRLATGVLVGVGMLGTEVGLTLVTRSKEVVCTEMRDDFISGVV